MSIQKITPEMVENSIANIEFIHRNNKLTVCIITLKNGFMLADSMGVVRPELFDPALGEKYAKEKTLDKVWLYLGTCLQQEINPIVLSDLE
jgi:hypothetical protein